MNYRNCIPVNRFEVGQTVFFFNLNPRTILKVLKTGYKYKDEITGKILSSVKYKDPYMIHWGKKEY